MPRGCARIGLPAPHDDIDVERIELEPIAPAAGTLGRHQGCAAAEEGIEDDIAAVGAVENHVGDRSDRLYRRVKRRKLPFLTRAAESGTARIER